MDCIGYIDIFYEEIMAYVDKAKKKKDVCRIMPDGRFNICSDGTIRFNALVCSRRMGGNQTGVSAEWCENCKIERESKDGQK